MIVRDFIIWVNREHWLWIMQLVVAIISLSETLLLTYLGYKVSAFTLLQSTVNECIFSQCLFFITSNSQFDFKCKKSFWFNTVCGKICNVVKITVIGRCYFAICMALS